MGHLVERFGAGVQVTPDVRSVAECFRRLADAHLPYERFVEGAEKLADWLSWDRVAEEYIDMYERVLGGE
jgi:glycosyltransferase involved in cell wall biosynthesis